MTGSKKPLDRYIQVLEVISAASVPATLQHVVNILGLPKATVYRLLNGLVESNLIVPGNGRGSGYTLSERMLNLLHLGSTGDYLELVTKHHLQKLSESTGFTSYLGKRIGSSARSVVMQTPAATPVIYVAPGCELSPHGSAAGKAIFAYQSEEILQEMVKTPLPKLTAHTICDPQALFEEYEKVRDQGLAQCVSEDVEGFAALACPVDLPQLGVIYSVGITGTVDAFERAKQDEIVGHLKTAAEQLSLALQSGAKLKLQE